MQGVPIEQKYAYEKLMQEKAAVGQRSQEEVVTKAKRRRKQDADG